MASKLKIVRSFKRVKELVQHCKTTGYASFDFETMGLEYYEPDIKPICIGISFQIGSTWVVPLHHDESPFSTKKVNKIMKLIGTEIMENWDIVKICWNAKFEYKWFLRYGHKIKGRLFCAQLAKYTLDEERPNDLKSWVDKLFPEYGDYEDENKKMVTKMKGWKNMIHAPLKGIAKYCGLDCDLTFRLMAYFERRMIKMGFYNLFRNLLMMATRVLGESEFEGMLVDREYLEQLNKKYEVDINDCLASLKKNRAILKFERKLIEGYKQQWIETVEKEIAQIRKANEKNAHTLIRNREQKIIKYRAGQFNKKETEKLEGVNFGSPQQLNQFFFLHPDGLKLKPVKYTDSGAPSTDEESLEMLRKKDKSGIIDHLLEYRGLTKIHSTYVQGMYNCLSSKNRIHANYKVFGTVTGRLSCGDPNFQNIPRGTTSADIKLMFIPPPGFIYYEVDYGQAELRIAAELSEDENMIAIFQKGFNIHTATACLVNGGIQHYAEAKSAKDDDKHPKHLFWVKQIKRAKTINFGILFGQTEKKLSIELECTEKEALQFIADWFKQYPKLGKWIKRQRKFAHDNEYVLNMFGRKRRLYDINNREAYGKMLESERQAVNSPIQGASSDFALLSTVVIREKIMKGELPKDMIQVNTVHDSIGFYVRPEDVHKVNKVVVEVCNNPDTLRYFGFQLKHVGMKASPEVGISSWGAKKEYDAWTNYPKLYAEHLAKKAAA